MKCYVSPVFRSISALPVSLHFQIRHGNQRSRHLLLVGVSALLLSLLHVVLSLSAHHVPCNNRIQCLSLLTNMSAAVLLRDSSMSQPKRMSRCKEILLLLTLLLHHIGLLTHRPVETRLATHRLLLVGGHRLTSVGLPWRT